MAKVEAPRPSPLPPIPGALMRVGKEGGSPSPVAALFSPTGGLAVDATNAYWSTTWTIMDYSSVNACALGGCDNEPSLLGTGGSGAYIGGGGSVGPIAVDATCVYWSTSPPQCDPCPSAGLIWKAAK